MFLYRALKDKDEKMKMLTKCLTLTLRPDDLLKIHEKMQQPWGLEENVDEPKIAVGPPMFTVASWDSKFLLLLYLLL